MRSPLPQDLLALVFEWHKPSCVVVYENPDFNCLVYWRYSMNRLLSHYRINTNVRGRYGPEQMFRYPGRGRHLLGSISDAGPTEEEETTT